MNSNAEQFIEEPKISKTRKMTAVIAVVAQLSLSVACGVALAGDHESRAGGYRESDNYESRIYGILEKLPQDLIGTWVVNSREIMVTKDTRIKEKHGKVVVGAYVEVEGNTTGKTFTAFEVEVKRSKRSGR